MNRLRPALAPTCIAGFLIASLMSHERPQLSTASAELFATNPSDSTERPHWQHTAWEHWGSPLLDPQHFPYSVVFVGDQLQNIQKNDIETAIRRSVDTWNDITCALDSLQFDGFRNSLADVATNEIPVFIPPSNYWDQQKTLIASTNMNSPAIALNTAHFTWSLEPAPFQYLTPNTATETPASPLIVDLQSVLTHELGHVLGLWHSSDDATAVMTAKYLPDAGQRVLAADDKFALCHLFPKPGNHSECATDSDCPQSSCVTDGTFQVCQKHQANPGEYCALDLLHCAHGCIIDSPPTGTGYCTALCQTDADCPAQFQCLTSENQSTCRIVRPQSPPTPDAQTSCSTLIHDHANPRTFTPLLILLATSLFARNKTRNKTRNKRRQTV